MRAILVLRRARRDGVLLVVVAVLVGFAVALSTLLPRLVTQAVDEGARAAVARAATDADIVIRTVVGRSFAGSDPAASFDQLAELTADLPQRLPGALKGVIGAPSVTVSSSDATGLVDDGSGAITRLAVQFAALGADQQGALQLVAGRLPRDGGQPLEVAISQQAAAAASLDVGSTMSFVGPGSKSSLVATVVGIVSSNEETSRAWRDLRRMWQPTSSSRDVAGAGAGIVALATPASMDWVENVVLDTFATTIRVPFVPDAFTAEQVSAVGDAVRGLQLHGFELAEDFPAQLNASSNFEDALGDFPQRSRAAIAQSSLLIAGLLGVAAAVLAQLGRLLALRRTGDLALERARGAALPAVAIGAIAESLPVTVIGAAAGLLLVGTLVPTPASIVVALVAVLAPPVQAVLIARDAWWSRRIAANAVDRRAVERARRARRISLEVVVVVLAAAAIAAIRTRGLLQGATVGIDPLLAAAPLLLAAVLAIVLLRIYPFVIRGIARLATRSTGALGVLGAAQAQRALAALPVLALTLATALVIGGGLIIDTVDRGQQNASWSSVGADARVTGKVSDADVERVAALPGVTAAGSFHVIPEVGVTGGPATNFVTLVAVGDGYPGVVGALDRTPAAGHPGDADRLGSLATAADVERMTVVVDPELADRLGDLKEFVITIGGTNLRVQVAGVVATVPGYLHGAVMYADRASLADRLGAPIDADTTLIVGPGAAAAAAAVKGGTVLTRSQWIHDQQHEALVAGVHRVMLVSTGSVAVFAVIALAAGVLAGTRNRARSLALLRTLGMRSRLGWWLAAAETAPVVVAALVGGILSGVGIVLLLGPSLGLAALAGGSDTPTPSLSPPVGLAVVGAAVALLLIAVAVEVAAHWRDRLSEVLRVGETI